MSGFTGSNGWLYLDSEVQVLLTDSRYEQQAAAEAPEWDARIVPGALAAAVAELPGARAARIGVDPEHVQHATWAGLETALGQAPQSSASPVGPMRAVKSAEEIASIRAALEVMEQVLFEVATEVVQPGVIELDVAAEIDYRARRAGATAMAFDTIVATGARGALPHARPSTAVFVPGDRIVIDCGCVVAGYCSDITRSVVIGEDAADWVTVHDAVDEARRAAIMRIQPGVAAADVDAAARDVLDAHGLADFFGHSLGHGVGLEVHEGPRLSSRSAETLQAGMVITVEPGVYLPGRGGIRLEDMVAVVPDGARRLNTLSTAAIQAGSRD